LQSIGYQLIVFVFRYGGVKSGVKKEGFARF